MAFGIPYPNTRRQQQLGWSTPKQREMDRRLLREQRQQERVDAKKRPGEWP